MGRYKKILTAIDGSASSMHALRESFKLAVNEKSWITVVSVAPPYLGDLDLVGVGNILESLKKPCEKALSDAVATAKAEGTLIKTVCEEGEPCERIVDLAEAENCDVIVMGRRGLKHHERAFVGNVAARVIGLSRRDVLIVPGDSSIGWSSIVVATDGSIYSRAAAEKAIDFAKSYGGRLGVVSIVDVPPEFYAEAPNAHDAMVGKAKMYANEVRAQAEAAGVKSESFVGEGDAYRLITEVASKEKADIIVMGSHGRTGLKRLLMGSVAEKVIGHASCPVLIVRY